MCQELRMPFNVFNVLNMHMNSKYSRRLGMPRAEQELSETFTHCKASTKNSRCRTRPLLGLYKGGGKVSDHLPQIPCDVT